MSITAKIAAVLLIAGLAACGRSEPEPTPAPVVAPEPVFTGKV